MGVRAVFVTLAIVLSANPLFAQAPQAASSRPTSELRLGAVALHELHRLQGSSTAPAVQRRHDSVLNGALIGASAGVASGLAVCRLMEPWDTCLAPGPQLRLGAVGAGVGIAVDALIRTRDVDLRGSQLSVAPVVSRSGRGLRVALRF